ncbi:MAG: putative peptidase [Planctomycetota bacterium]|jgi:predicted peptidase
MLKQRKSIGPDLGKGICMQSTAQLAHQRHCEPRDLGCQQHWRHLFVMITVVISLHVSLTSRVLAQSKGEEYDGGVKLALARAGKNRSELELALTTVPKKQEKGLRFLITYMPERDLQSLSSVFLLENVAWAYRAWREAPWHKSITEDVFLNEILPYANINERRDNWRKDFHARFAKEIKAAKTPGQAATILNQHIFKTLNVKYSTKRPKPDQSPYESMAAGTASCTGLSILLIDACRSVGVPARFVGTPLWSDGSGNHSWVEIWDQGWHFTGAAEPTGDDLDKGWFEGRASKALRDDAKRAIYAVSYRKTPQFFPLLWEESARYVSAVNVSNRYTSRRLKIPQGKGRIRFRIVGPNGGRLAKLIKVVGEDKQVVFEGRTNDERFDGNDHVTAILKLGSSFVLSWEDKKGVRQTRSFEAKKDEQLVSVDLATSQSKPLDQLKEFLNKKESLRGYLADQAFATTALSKEESVLAKEILWRTHVGKILKSRTQEMTDRVIPYKNLKMKFHYTVFGEKPLTGRSLYISMHGGGGAPAKVNDQQWRNQQRLYQPKEGVYVAPRAPTDTWNLWHESHIDPMFDRLIENMIIFEDVNPDRVYIMGYSAGGDGVYQLAPRMSDRWAAAAMMAGHPNETSPLGLRNVPFILQMGGKDAAYKRNQIAADWSKKLAKLKKSDHKGYEHFVKIYPKKGHWMDREDAIALPWMAKFDRKLRTDHIVWLQDDVCQSRYYWLAVDDMNKKKGVKVIAKRRGQKIDLKGEGFSSISIRLDDSMIDLDRPISVTVNKGVVHKGPVKRTIAVINKTLNERGDPKGMFTSEITIDLQQK